MLSEIIRHEILAALRTRRLVVTVGLFVLFAALGALATFTAIREAQRVAIEALAAQGIPAEMATVALNEQSDEIARSVLENVGPGWENYAAPLRLSMVVPVYFVVALGLLPLLVLSASFDLFSSDLRARTLCYWSMRVPRRTLVVGRVIAQCAIIGIALLAVGAVTTIMGALMVRGFAPLHAAAGFGYATALLLVPAATWISVVAFASASTRSPMAAAAFALLLYVAIWSLGIPQHFVDEADGTLLAALAGLGMLTPGYWADGLWSAQLQKLVPSIVALGAIGAAGTAAAAWRLGRHDL